MPRRGWEPSGSPGALDKSTPTANAPAANGGSIRRMTSAGRKDAGKRSDVRPISAEAAEFSQASAQVRNELACTALSRRSMIPVAMIGLGQSSAIATYRSKANRMRRSHDENGSIQMNMYSLGVTDLDLSISPDVFGLPRF